MTFDEWWGHQPTRETAKMFKEGAQEIWDAACNSEREECAKTVEREAHRNVTKFGLEYVETAKSESWAMLQAAHAIRKRSSWRGTQG